jgi:hypothetical protein
LSGLPAPLLAQARVSPSEQPPPSAGATIRGRITSADNSRPLRGARVQLSAPELPTARATATDSDGRYEFTNLSAGRYTMSATMGSFIGLSYGQTRPFEAGKPIVLAEKQRLDNVDLRLPRGGAIAGIVLDDAGQPLINALITAFRPQFVRGVRQLISIATARTSDSGEFRVFGLSPGSYVVSAAKSFSLSPEWATVNAESGYAPSFFPGSPNVADAGRVTVRLGQTTDAINFALTATKAGSIGGAVFTLDGRPAMLGVAQPRVRRIGDTQRPNLVMSGDGIHSNFRASGLPPGEYEISAMSMASSASNPVPPQGTVQRVTLNGENLSGIRLIMEPLPTGTGRVIVDPTATGAPAVAAIRIGTEAVDPDAALFTVPSRSATLGADMTFTVHAAPGRTLIRPMLPRGWTLKAVRVENQDVTDTGIEFLTGASPVRGIEVEITNRLT